MMNKLSNIARVGLVSLLFLALPTLVQAAHHETAPAEAQSNQEANGRAMAIEVVAEITAIDLETRQVTLLGPSGSSFTLKSHDRVVKLEDVNVGDKVIVTYLAAMESELREPTPEELAEPWVEVDEEAISDDAAQPGVADMRIIRAVVTIEDMNPELGTVTIKDSRGMFHLVGDVEPEKMEGVEAGQTAVIVFAEALALSLQKQEELTE